MTSFPTSFSKGRSVVTMLHYFGSFTSFDYNTMGIINLRVTRPDSLPRLWRYINLLLTYLLTCTVCPNTAKQLKPQNTKRN